MPPKFNYIAVLNYTTYFAEPVPEDPLQFIRSYPTDYILLKLAQINALLFQDDEILTQAGKILNDVIYAGTPVDHPDLVAHIQTAKQDHQTLFSSSAISLLIKCCLENFVESHPDQRIVPLKFSRDLFKTILVFNELYYARISSYDLESFQGIFVLGLQQESFIRSNFNFKIVTSIKFAFISKFLHEHARLKQEGLEFCSYLEIGNPWIFGRFFLDMLATANAKSDDAKFVLDSEGIPRGFLQDFILDKATLINKKNISFTMDVIPKPFYLLKDEHPLVLDYSYLQFAIDQGFFFGLYQHTSLKNKEKFKNFNEFKGYIGLHFFEQYLVRQYLEAIFYRRNQKVISTPEYQDFIVKPAKNDVFIFEVKMTDLHGRTIEAMDFDAFKKFIDDNFLSSKIKDGKNKGAYQIRSQMDHLLEEDSTLCKLLEVREASRLNIYPVIVYSDSNLDLAGVNRYVNDRFHSVLEELRPEFQSVKPVLMLSVNLLIEYFYLIKNNPNALTGWINDYFKNVKGWKQKYNKGKGPHAYMMYNRSFSDFLQHKVRDDQMTNNLREMATDFKLDIENFAQTS